mmetsp:Transcript_126263/g.252237  ORF Transcript_126263/g.252237 Transcript_126263/m.252237 type:complete len:236 (+) Transcript_126263:84-791(+)
MGASCNSGGSGQSGYVQIFGTAVIPDVLSCVLLARDLKCGDLVEVKPGEHTSWSKLRINPFGELPSLQDGDFFLAEETTILRYLANTYAPERYGGMDPERKAVIDWALDWCRRVFDQHLQRLVHPILGLPLVEQEEPANKNPQRGVKNTEATTVLGVFAQKFLSKSTFVGGELPLTIADYKCGTAFWLVGHATVKAKTGFDLPQRIRRYVQDFLKGTDNSDLFDSVDEALRAKAK